MNVNWLSIIILYAWYLTGLYTIKRIVKDKKPNPYQILLSLFFGPFVLGWILLQENKDKILEFFNSGKQGKETNHEFLNLVF